MKTTIRLFSFGLALLLSVTVAPTARAVCQDACLTLEASEPAPQVVNNP